MTDWLLDTLLWTGVLIALVLAVRQPVARHLGARAAYALWALPFARLVLPPLELPAVYAPAPREPALIVSFSAEAPALPAVRSAPVDSFDWAGLLVALWLTGAMIFLVRRFALYARMRRELLADAVPVGRAGRVRLVETPLAPSPVAFGVIDKVVALPPAFMAATDRTARDLALAHELAHHRGHDLLANFAVQPLFALHWFNPLGWFGWAAMRRDQEAACDARVVERIARPEKAAYAALIAGLAAGPNIALAAPMACPVLGEKSIIQRLRSLTMTDISPRRRLLGRALVAGGLLALPLTASISYADVPPAPVAPVAPAVSTLPGAVAPAAPDAPPLALWAQTSGETAEPAPADDATVERRVVVIRNKDGETTTSEANVTLDKGGRTIVIGGKGMSEEERARLRADLSQSMRQMEIDLAEARDMRRLAMIEMRRELDGELSRIDIDCKDSADARAGKLKDGRKVMVLCRTNVMASALVGLRQAREEIARDTDIPGEARAEVLRALDEQIAKLSGTDG